jgi:hypothetical protein
MENKKDKNEREQIPYQFTANPLNLMYIMDSDCLKMLNILIQEASYWDSQKQLTNGYFYKSINELKDNMFMANDQDVRLTIEALYSNGLVDVINQGEKHKASKFKINIDKIIEINSMSITDVKKFYPRICKLKRGCVCSYMKRENCTNDQNKEVGNVSDIDKVSESATNCITDCHSSCTTDCNTDCSTTCTPKLDKLYLLNKSDSSNKIDDNINNNNIAKENIEKESFHHLNTHIEDNKKDKVDINDQKVIDASVPLAVAHPLEPTKKMTKGEHLISKFSQAYKEMKKNEFYNSLQHYTIDELKYIDKMIPTLTIKMNDNQKGMIKYYISILQKKKKEVA